MRAVWKYELKVSDTAPAVSRIGMPNGSTILRVAWQGDRPQLWVFVEDSEAPVVERKFITFATGEPMGDVKPEWYVGTFVIPSIALGELVWHVFEVPT